MNRLKPPLCALTVLLALVPAALLAQTDCEEGDGPLNRNPPQGIAPAQIIQNFTAKEFTFRQARETYSYTQDVTMQTLNGHTVDGEFREVRDITVDAKGKRTETVASAPQSTLTRVTMTKEDFAEIRDKMPFVTTSEEVAEYDIPYVGTQHVDEIDTYVFDVSPKRVANKRYFQGRIWVDSHDLQIVKTCGNIVPDNHAKDGENLIPRFVTYREQIDGQYWFPTYARADEVLHFNNQEVHIREIIKYTNYKRSGSR